MKIYFAKAQVPANDELYDMDGSFRVDGEYYWSYLEYGTNPGGLDEVALHDGCNRFVPIHVDHIDELIQALERVLEMHNTQQEAERIQELAQSDAEQTLGW